MSLKFQIKNEWGSELGVARRAALELAHGVVQTPVFMPVGTAATVKTVPQETLETLGASGVGAGIILANTYHLYLRPGHELIQRLGGIHKFMSWRRAMLTDSGGFQVFSLSKLRKVTPDGVEFRSHLDGSKHFFSPEHSMEVQIALGADVMMAFDECTEHPATRERVKASMELTHAWARRSRDYWLAHREEVPWFGEFGSSSERRTQALFGIVQGGMYADLRRESAERLVELDLPGYAIGGLSVGEPRELTREMIAATLEHLPKEKPRYVMGVGYPEEIVEYAAMGVDMMDCVLPTRAARHGLLFTSAGRVNIKNKKYADDDGPIDAECGCQVCARYSRAYLRHLFAAGESLAGTLASMHNLALYLDTMQSARDAIERGTISEFATGYRARAKEAAEDQEEKLQ